MLASDIVNQMYLQTSESLAGYCIGVHFYSSAEQKSSILTVSRGGGVQAFFLSMTLISFVIIGQSSMYLDGSSRKLLLLLWLFACGYHIVS